MSSTTVCALAATCANVSGPYKCWLPVINHTSNGAKIFLNPLIHTGPIVALIPD